MSTAAAALPGGNAKPARAAEIALAMGVGLLAVRRRGLRALFWQIPLMPVYWLLI